MDIKAAGSGAATDASASDAQKIQLKRLTQEFEAMFLAEMLRGMRSTMLEEQREEGLGNEAMIDTFDVELGRSLSLSGGLGLSRIMLEALTRREAATAAPVDSGDGDATAAATSSTASTGVSPNAGSHARVASVASHRAGKAGDVRLTSDDQGRPRDGRVPTDDDAAGEMPGPVTSRFGWRKDPFTGRTQFHAGTDVRMAYGREVQTVAAGKVSSVGERSGYGLTVVIDHGNGLETRYAHLSNTAVKVGDYVDAGQMVARSGNSGRSTGPHLHLEARLNGKAVDVASVLKSKA